MGTKRKQSDRDEKKRKKKKKTLSLCPTQVPSLLGKFSGHVEAANKLCVELLALSNGLLLQVAWDKGFMHVLCDVHCYYLELVRLTNGDTTCFTCLGV